MSINNLRRRKLRTVLTVLGVIIGTYSTLFVATPIAYEIQRRKAARKTALATA